MEELPHETLCVEFEGELIVHCLSFVIDGLKFFC